MKIAEGNYVRDHMHNEAYKNCDKTFKSVLLAHLFSRHYPSFLVQLVKSTKLSSCMIGNE